MDSLRQERLISCMNAAVNLCGVVSFAELIRLYNRSAADESAPVSNLLTEAEIDEILALPPPDDFDLEDQERWFKAVELDGVRYLVSEYGFAIDIGEPDERIDEEGVRKQLEAFVTPDLRILPWDDFTPLVRNTRAWNYRGHTETELVNAGVLKVFLAEDVEDVFDRFMKDAGGPDDEESDVSARSISGTCITRGLSSRR